MKDLDFDELDRAVNSLISSSKETENKTEVDTKLADTEEKKDTVSESSDNSDQSTERKASTSTFPSLAARRSGSGRFMDVVHPSSNMRPSTTVSKSAFDQTEKPEPADDKTAPVETKPETVTPETPKPETTDSNWPNSIDFKEYKSVQTDKKEEPKPEEDEDIDKINDEITKTLNQASGDTPESPFIAGTKVEKRPLGAFSEESPAETTEDTEKEDKKQPEKLGGLDLNADGQPQANIDTPLPAELHDDILSIESDSSTTNPEIATDKHETKLDVETEPVKPAAETAKPAADNQPTVPTSITQQYKEQPSTGDQKTGAIYDTDAYHKALLHPAKKKSGWVWVLWITILLIIGAGTGAAVYFFMLAK